MKIFVIAILQKAFDERFEEVVGDLEIRSLSDKEFIFFFKCCVGWRLNISIV